MGLINQQTYLGAPSVFGDLPWMTLDSDSFNFGMGQISEPGSHKNICINQMFFLLTLQ
jgi:hypothetical protein